MAKKSVSSKQSKKEEVVVESTISRDEAKAAAKEANELLGLGDDSDNRVRIVKADTAETISEKIADTFRAASEDDEQELPELDNVSDELLTILSTTGVLDELFEEADDEDEEAEEEDAEEDEEEDEEDEEDEEEDEDAEESDDEDEADDEDEDEGEDAEDEDDEDEDEEEASVVSKKKAKTTRPVHVATAETAPISQLYAKLDEVAERIEKSIAGMVEQFKKSTGIPGRFDDVDVAPRKVKGAPVVEKTAKKPKLTAEQKSAIAGAEADAETLAKKRMGRSGDLQGEDERRQFLTDNASKIRKSGVEIKGDLDELSGRSMYNIIREYFITSARRKTEKRLGLAE